VRLRLPLISAFAFLAVAVNAGHAATGPGTVNPGPQTGSGLVAVAGAHAAEVADEADDAQWAHVATRAAVASDGIAVPRTAAPHAMVDAARAAIARRGPPQRLA
jgi:hypothetical protein